MYLPLKRLMDIVGAFVALLLLSWVFLITAILIKLDSKGPVFFSQDRVGQNKKPFKMIKFRSMVVDADKMKDDLQHLNENEGPFFKIKNDPRVTRVGKFIRKYSIDEIPQFINVLRGDMSLVGPRPALYREIEFYSQEELDNLGIKPGITCHWQVSGRSDSSGNRLKMDGKYIAEFGLIVDMILLIKTPAAAFKGRGAC
jgi:lipopolysaccharide/colanic/teichoic acid biosynthesis glycosyltransferase